MSREKGLFKDDLDRHSQAHQNICAWFLKNAEQFVRMFFGERPKTEVRVTFEHLITNNKFIIGFADVLLEYETAAGTKECVLIEVKSQLRDYAAALRQIRTYRKYLPKITKMCLVHGDARIEPWADEDERMRRYFSSQDVYVADYEGLEMGRFSHEPFTCSFPSGRHIVEIKYAEPYGYIFDITLEGMGFDSEGKDSKTEIYILKGLDFVRPFAKFLGVSVDQWYFDWSLTPFRIMQGTKLLLDVERALACDGCPTERLALHSLDLASSLEID